MTLDHELSEHLLEWVRGRYFGKYRGTLTDNADPTDRGRLKVRVPAVLVSPLIPAGTVFRVPAGSVPLAYSVALLRLSPSGSPDASLGSWGLKPCMVSHQSGMPSPSLSAMVSVK